MISACTQPSVSNEEDNNANYVKVNLFADNGKLLSTIVDPNRTSEILQIIESRKPLMEKYLPIFTMQLVIEKDGLQEVWLFSQPKYIKKKSKSENQIYFIENVKEFAVLINS